MGGFYRGWLYPTTISLEATKGVGVTVEAQVFIPQVQPGQRRLPNILGFYDFLAKIRFAVDPENNHFFFAALGNDDC